MGSIKVLFLLSVLVATVIAGGGHGGGDGGHGGHPYSFEYGVHDGHTGDKKKHYEHSDGHNVHGEYSLKEPDGTTRIVKYHADKHGGFNAVVSRVGHAQHPAHYGHGDGHGGHGGGGHGGHGGGGHGDGGHGGTSYVGITHWGGDGGHGGHGGDGGHGGH